MDTEIEIKFFAAQKSGKRLPAVLAQHKVVDTSVKQLHNVYFDTADNTFRKYDIGMRVRTCDEQSVQTVKTRGRVMGGLHQRPEYNIGIDCGRPQLSLFPAKIWPDGLDVEQLQSDLTPLFTTHFERQAWLLSLDDDTLVEVALDTGEVEANGKTEPICEIELEIVKGDVAQLFNLAEQIAELGNVRLGNVSKAQRGYRLAQGYKTKAPVPLGFVDLQGATTLDEAFYGAIQTGFSHWQQHEQLFCELPNLAMAKQMLHGVQLIHQALLHYSGCAPVLLQQPWLADMVWLEQKLAWVEHGLILDRMLEKRGHYLRKLPNQKRLVKHFSQQKEALPAIASLAALINTPRYATLIVNLNRWLYGRAWQQDKQVREQLSAPLAAFAANLLDSSWYELTKNLSVGAEYSAAQLLALKGLLQRNLLVGNCVGDLYDAQLCDEFRHPWLDMLKGIEDLELVSLVGESMGSVSDDDQKLCLRWIKRKTSSLVEAMTFSITEAIQVQPYWQ